MTKALEDIAAERQRQINVEGWALEHDDGHKEVEMATAAACYALGDCSIQATSAYGDVRVNMFKHIWPWSMTWWKPRDKRRNLVRAGALILAEIERLDRLAADPVEAQRMRANRLAYEDALLDEADRIRNARATEKTD